MAIVKTLGAAIRQFLEHPATGVVVGIALAASGLDDLMEALEAGDRDLSVHHGMLLFGAFKVLSAMGEALERLTKVSERLGTKDRH